MNFFLMSEMRTSMSIFEHCQILEKSEALKLEKYMEKFRIVYNFPVWKIYGKSIYNLGDWNIYPDEREF